MWGLIMAALSQIAFAYTTLQIKDLQMEKCTDVDYSVTVNNVSLELGGKMKISGSLYSEVDLVGPIKASVDLKRSIWGIWIPMPCDDKMGSCTYNNLCDYGYPKNKTCSDVFQKNNIPCRCPVPKGNYTIIPALELEQDESILRGKYKGTVTVTQNSLLLSCYNVWFVLYDEYDNYSINLI